MKFILDNSVSPSLRDVLIELGHDAVHVREYGMASASDTAILDRAILEDRAIVASDTDFGTLYAMRHIASPSLILFRGLSVYGRVRQTELLRLNLANIMDALIEGSIIVMTVDGTRVRQLPI